MCTLMASFFLDLSGFSISRLSLVVLTRARLCWAYLSSMPLDCCKSRHVEGVCSTFQLSTVFRLVENCVLSKAVFTSDSTGFAYIVALNYAEECNLFVQRPASVHCCWLNLSCGATASASGFNRGGGAVCKRAWPGLP